MYAHNSNTALEVISMGIAKGQRCKVLDEVSQNVDGTMQALSRCIARSMRGACARNVEGCLAGSKHPLEKAL